MNRRTFVASLIGGLMTSSIFKTEDPISTTRMPSLFVGHGSPMNAIANNDFTKFLHRKGDSLPRPKMILAISAHWETRGTKVLKAEKPETIHDFYGFPDELFAIQYPAPGSLAMTDQIATLLKAHEAEADSRWGLDHGTWSILTHLYPKAEIPVVQLSLNQNLSPLDHFQLAKDLKPLRDQGVLILGSGNITHNLRLVDWSPDAKPMQWALEFDEMIKQALLNGDDQILFSPTSSNLSLWKQAVPSLEHYLPLLYILGTRDEKDLVTFPYEEMQMGSLSMRAVEFAAS